MNNDTRQAFAWFAGISAAAVWAGFLLCWQAGLLVLVFSAALGTVFYAAVRARRMRLNRLIQRLDQVLHDEDRLLIADMDEGELSVLESEIAKLTVRLREQNAALKKEKAHLADSLADIAHQLRTPLTSANLILSLLKKEPEETERRILLRESGELYAQMDWLVTSLLKLSRLDAGMVAFSAEPLAVSALMEAAARPLLILMELHDITFTIDAPEEAELRGDLGWLSEALTNLLKNCMESAGDHGTIEMTCESNPLYTEIRIRDSGPGFDTAELPHLFERYYRGKSSKATGYGIGLALCKSVITRQGGSLIAKNHPQGGALFCVRFPK